MLMHVFVYFKNILRASWIYNAFSLSVFQVVGLPVVARMKTSGRSDLPALDKKSASDLIKMIQLY